MGVIRGHCAECPFADEDCEECMFVEPGDCCYHYLKKHAGNTDDSIPYRDYEREDSSGRCIARVDYDY